jgi:hypothetical protein
MRSVVALIAALLLVLCQTAFAAQAYAHSPLPVQDSAAAAPCHEVADDGKAPSSPTSSATCEAGKALNDIPNVHVYALAELPAVDIAYASAAPRGAASRTSAHARAVCHSPPLSVLHCRFLN